MSRPKYFNDAATITTIYTYFSFGFNPSTVVTISADRGNSDDIYISSDGINADMRLTPGEPYNKTNDFIRGIYVKSNTGTQACRISAY